MSKKLSQFYGLKIFTERAEYVGVVEDIILNIEKGEIMWLTLKSFKNKPLVNTEINQILKEDTVPYVEVVQAGDIVICKKNPKKATKSRK